jgi:Zn-dependent protease with chaperone function
VSASAAERVVMGCPMCGAFNRVARGQQEEATCGGCRKPLAGATWRRSRLPLLQSKSYEHPWDRRALAALEKIPALGTAVSLFNKHGLDHIVKVECTGANLLITEQNVPEALTALREVCKVLAMPEVPELYVEYGDQINAYAAGVHQPVICLTSATIECLTRDELYFILGHEVGHIKSSHMLYTQLARLLPALGDLIGDFTLNVGSLISRGLHAALLHWYRMSELTSDRAGLLACQDVETGIRAFVKTAGLPPRHYDRIEETARGFRDQAIRFEEFDEELARRLAKMIAGSNMQHPWTVARASQLLRWAESGEYDRVMRGGGAPVAAEEAV